MDELNWDKRTKEERAEIRAEMLKEAVRVLSDAHPDETTETIRRMASNLVNSSILHERQRNKVQAALLN